MGWTTQTGNLMSAIITAIQTALTGILGCVGDVVDSIFGSTGDLTNIAPFVYIALALGLVSFGFATVKRLIKGY